MKKIRPGQKIKLTSVEELLGVSNEESAMDIEVVKIQPFRNHPFKVIDDEKMEDLVESIRTNGILSPVLIRPIGNDIYINADYYVGDTRCVLSIGFRNKLHGDVPITLKKQSIREVVKKECKVYAIAAKSMPVTQSSWELTYCEQGFAPEEWLSE